MSTLGLRAAKINDLDKAADIITSQAENQTFTMNMLPSVQFLPPRLFSCYVLFLLGFAILFLLGFALCSCWVSLFFSFAAFSTKTVMSIQFNRNRSICYSPVPPKILKSNLYLK